MEPIEASCCPGGPFEKEAVEADSTKWHSVIHLDEQQPTPEPEKPRQILCLVIVGMTIMFVSTMAIVYRRWMLPTPFRWQNNPLVWLWCNHSSVVSSSKHSNKPNHAVWLILETREELLSRVDEYFRLMSISNYDGNEEEGRVPVFSSESFTPMQRWDISRITDCSAIFSTERNDKAKYMNDAGVSRWNTSSCRTMEKMFYGASSFNRDLSQWNTSNVKNMSGMFAKARSFHQDLSAWSTRNVKDMSFMFDGATSFNNNLSMWQTSSVTNMRSMFSEAWSFNQDLSMWDTSRVADMSYMFYVAWSFNRNVSRWNTAHVLDMSYMFFQASSFNHDLSTWNTSSVKDMSWMFYEASGFNQDLSNWDISNVMDMGGMFLYDSSFNQDLCLWQRNLNNSLFSEMQGFVFEGTACPFVDEFDESHLCQRCSSLRQP